MGILFTPEGGIDIGDVDSKAKKLEIPIDVTPTDQDIQSCLLKDFPSEKVPMVVKFIRTLYKVYVDLYFTYLEVNPLVITDTKIHILDLAAKLDATAEFMCKLQWGEVDYPAPFGRDAYPEEAYIADLDSKS